MERIGTDTLHQLFYGHPSNRHAVFTASAAVQRIHTRSYNPAAPGWPAPWPDTARAHKASAAAPALPPAADTPPPSHTAVSSRRSVRAGSDTPPGTPPAAL